jgi:hypothetical protein
MPIVQLRQPIGLCTRLGNQIENETDLEDVRWGDKVQAEDFKSQFRHETHRPVSPSRKYNCHGLSFASRRTNIWESKEILKILKEDDYEELKATEPPLPGDIVIYFLMGDVWHSGIVVEIEPLLKVPIILSKWGKAHEVVHKVRNCPYNEAETVIFYRIKS